MPICPLFRGSTVGDSLMVIPAINEKALKCKPSALIFGRGCAKKSIALQGSYNIGLHVKIM